MLKWKSSSATLTTRDRFVRGSRPCRANSGCHKFFDLVSKIPHLEELSVTSRFIALASESR
jgi:hypothetical protein